MIKNIICTFDLSKDTNHIVSYSIDFTGTHLMAGDLKSVMMDELCTLVKRSYNITIQQAKNMPDLKFILEDQQRD